MRSKLLICMALLLVVLAWAGPGAHAYNESDVIQRVGPYEVVPAHVIENETDNASLIGDTSGADGTITFWQLPLWIQLTQVTWIATLSATALALILKFGPLIIGKLKTPRDNEIRDRIYNHIKDNPGSTVASIARKEGLNLGTVRYHVGQLQSTHRITLVKSDKFVRLFQNSNTYTDREKTVLSAINRPTALSIVSYLHDHPGTTTPQIAGSINITDSGTNVQLKKLLRDQIIRAEPAGRYLKRNRLTFHM
jgi:predicted transcriptional regulator